MAALLCCVLQLQNITVEITSACVFKWKQPSLQYVWPAGPAVELRSRCEWVDVVHHKWEGAGRAQRSSAECEISLFVCFFNIYNKYIWQYKIHVHIYIKLIGKKKKECTGRQALSGEKGLDPRDSHKRRWSNTTLQFRPSRHWGSSRKTLSLLLLGNRVHVLTPVDRKVYSFVAVLFYSSSVI